MISYPQSLNFVKGTLKDLAPSLVGKRVAHTSQLGKEGIAYTEMVIGYKLEEFSTTIITIFDDGVKQFKSNWTAGNKVEVQFAVLPYEGYEGYALIKYPSGLLCVSPFACLYSLNQIDLQYTLVYVGSLEQCQRRREDEENMDLCVQNNKMNGL
jgi:hypothetical protein